MYSEDLIGIQNINVENLWIQRLEWNTHVIQSTTYVKTATDYELHISHTDIQGFSYAYLKKKFSAENNYSFKKNNTSTILSIDKHGYLAQKTFWIYSLF